MDRADFWELRAVLADADQAGAAANAAIARYRETEARAQAFLTTLAGRYPLAVGSTLMEFLTRYAFDDATLTVVRVALPVAEPPSPSVPGGKTPAKD